MRVRWRQFRNAIHGHRRKLLRMFVAGCSAVLCMVSAVCLMVSLFPSHSGPWYWEACKLQDRAIWQQEDSSESADRAFFFSCAKTVVLEPGRITLREWTLCSGPQQPLSARFKSVSLPAIFSVYDCQHSNPQVNVGYFSNIKYAGLSVHLWLPTLLFAIYPLIVIRRLLRRRRRLRRGLCLTCGYSLAGNVSGVCPECGGQL